MKPRFVNFTCISCSEQLFLPSTTKAVDAVCEACRDWYDAQLVRKAKLKRKMKASPPNPPAPSTPA